MQRAYARAIIIAVTVFVFSAMVAACATDSTTPAPAESPTVVVNPTFQSESEATALAESEGESSGSGSNAVDKADEVVTAVEARTPVPSPTPDIIEMKVDDITAAAGLTDKSFLGLSMNDWANVFGSILIVALGYFVIVKLLARLIKWLLNRSDFKSGQAFNEKLGRELRWLLLLLLVRPAVLRLDFLNDQVRIIFDDLFFILITVLLTVIALKLIDILVDSYDDSLEPEDQRRLQPILVIVRRFCQLIVLIFAFGVGISHFGLSSSAFSATILLIGIVIAFGARGLVNDVISGFIILTTQPFRVGDSIYVENLRRRGEILEIGLRTTKIRTMENREVIIPNNRITRSEIINYAYPDPSFRLSTDMHLPYGSDMVQVRQVLTDAVRGVEGVLPDKPVAVLFLDFDKYAKRVAVRWWVANYNQEWVMRDAVNTALETALSQSGIAVAIPRYDLDIHNEGEDSDR